jgi:dipeptidyl aminopeptidase/acylaminoacyl peptidase
MPRNKSKRKAMKITGRYGTWKSPISGRSVGSGNHIFELKLDQEFVYIAEVHPEEEAARYSIMKVPSRGGKPIEIVPAPFNVRTRVHEYGGGAFLLSSSNLYFSNFDDQRLYSISKNGSGSALPISPEGTDTRYADGVFDVGRKRIICVREHHPIAGKRDAENKIISIDVADNNSSPRSQKVLVSGNDFYSFPRLSADGSKIAWITWNYPNMPFDGSELWVAEFDVEGRVEHKRKIAGGLDESVTQPVWSSSGALYFISDRTGWWNINRWTGKNVDQVCSKSADFCNPDWNLGLSTYSLSSNDLIVCTFAENGIWKLATLGTKNGALTVVKTPFTDIQHIQTGKGYAVFLAASPKEGQSLFRFDIGTRKIRKIYESPGETLGGSLISRPVSVTFPTENNATSQGFFYKPLNPSYKALRGELPPLVVMVHGGPTSVATSAIKGRIPFFTSRGFAVLDVNYGGSSGFGREYRRRLNGQWGIVDVDDCVNGTEFLAKRRLVDKDRAVIRGSSAGGWTTLCAVTFMNYFKAGACYYGISDLERWELDAHKFEAQYLHSLIGSYPQERDLFLERSPTHSAEKVSVPLLILQGLEDRVVPPSQSELMVDALRRANHSVEYIPFDWEQHDFRLAKTIEKSLEAELSLYLRALGIQG